MGLQKVFVTIKVIMSIKVSLRVKTETFYTLKI